MDLDTAIEMLYELAEGINPLTREPLSMFDCCRDEQIVRALYMVLAAGEVSAAAARSAAAKPAAAKSVAAKSAVTKPAVAKTVHMQDGRNRQNRTWLKWEDDLLCVMVNLEKPKQEICRILGRSPKAVAARLVWLGVIASRREWLEK